MKENSPTIGDMASGVEKIKKILRGDRLMISRIPRDTKREFTEFAKESF